jgi:hypothetical protein
MKHPVFALVWQTWRLSRRWYSWVLPVALMIGFAILNIQPRGLPPGAPAQLLLAPAVFMLIFSLAAFASLLAISMGNRNGFPFHFEYRLPISNFTLVIIPMLVLSLLCSSLYFIPMALFRVIYGLPFPLLPASALMAATVVFLVTGSWATTNTTVRSIAITLSYVLAISLFSIFDPVDMSSRILQPEQRNPQLLTNLIRLTGGEYAVLLAVSLCAVAIVLSSVKRQRCGDAVLGTWKKPVLVEQVTEVAATKADSVKGAGLMETLSDKVKIPCPTGKAWQAEIWAETKRYAAPIGIMSAALAVCIPVMVYTAGKMAWTSLLNIVYTAPLIVFFCGIGMSLFNRRQASGGYMNVFESSRPLRTLKLAAIQLVIVAIATGIGIVLVETSLRLSEPMTMGLDDLLFRIDDALPAMSHDSLLTTLAAGVVLGVYYLCIIALFSCLHSCSVFWGRKFLIGVMVLAFYGINLTVLILTGEAGLQTIINNIWGFAVLVWGITAMAAARILYLKVLTLRGAGIALALWGIFVVCAFSSVAVLDRPLATVAPELQALIAALLLLPLTFFSLTLWCYDRLRHG